MNLMENQGEGELEDNRSIIWGAVAVAIVFAFIGYINLDFRQPFLTTVSPQGTYRVELFGRQERPRLFSNEVRFIAFKNDKTLWDNIYLHSGDAFDLSFEVGFPDHRWFADNGLQLFRNENFEYGPATEASLTNKTNKAIKCLKLHSEDKLLIFDLKPGAQLSVRITPPKGDHPGVFIDGVYEGVAERNSSGIA